MRTPIESGVPDNKQYMHPALLKNYGNWKYHDRPRPGVLHHVSHCGDEVWTVRAGTQRQMDVYTIRKLCDIADTFAEGHVRFTIRSNIEFMVSDPTRSTPLIDALTEQRLPGRRHRQLGVDDRAHPGLAALRHSGHRRVGRGQGADGRPVRRSSSARTCPTACTCRPVAARSTAAARPTSPSSCSTPSRRRSTTTWSPTSASARRWWRAARWRRSARRWSTASPRWRSTRRNASAAAPATRPARRCRSTTRSTPSWRSGSAARTPTPAASPPS